MEFAKHTMEDVTLDHTMEQAWDVQAQLDNHDDIEIDLDIAEDRDVDVVVDDASVAASDRPPSLPGGPDAAHDADMFDEEYAEDHALNPEYALDSEEQQQQQYVDDGEYHEGDTFEAEMEDDYEEDIDAPIPGTTSTFEPQDIIAPEEVHHHQVPEPSYPRSHESPTSGTSETPVRQPPEGSIHGSPKAKPTVEEGYEHHDQPTEGVDEATHGTESLQGGGVEGDNEAHVGRGREPSPQDRVQADADYHTADEARKSIELEGHHHYAGADEAAAHMEEEPGGQITKNALNLHNIKIIYQENEISLFPPMEDDPTETYFLEDTGLAHEPIRQLFDACRLVLDDHISKDEELVLDIDCLGLHLSQSASQNSSTTLYQITEVYHSLCLNDGFNVPEPLYLSLSSTNFFDSLFKSLVQAVEAGNGLSSIDRWDDLDQYDMEDNTAFPEDEETGTSHASGGYYAETHPTKPAESQEEKHEVAGDTAEHVEPDIHGEQQEVDGGAAASAAASRASHHGETVTVQSEEDTVSTTYHEHGTSAEEQATNAENIVDSREAPEDWGVDEAAATIHSVEVQDDLSREDYVELHETSQPEQQSYTRYNETTQEDGSQAETAATSHDGPTEYVEELEVFDFGGNEPPVPEWQTQEALEPVQDSHGAADEHPEAVETHVDDFTESLESDVRQPEISLDETVIEASNDDTGQPDDIRRTTNGPPQEISATHPEERPGTPETAHSHFDIDEDIFRSPRPENTGFPLPEDDLAADSMPSIPGNQSRQTSQPSVVEPDDESYSPSADIEPGEVVETEDPAFQVHDEKAFADGSPVPAKRPRPDDDVSANKDLVPDLKRHRSE